MKQISTTFNKEVDLFLKKVPNSFIHQAMEFYLDQSVKVGRLFVDSQTLFLKECSYFSTNALYSNGRFLLQWKILEILSLHNS